MKYVVANFRINENALKQLRTLAHQQSLAKGQDITWAEIVRGLVEEMLVGTTDPAGTAATK